MSMKACEKSESDKQPKKGYKCSKCGMESKKKSHLCKPVKSKR